MFDTKTKIEELIGRVSNTHYRLSALETQSAQTLARVQQIEEIAKQLMAALGYKVVRCCENDSCGTLKVVKQK